MRNMMMVGGMLVSVLWLVAGCAAFSTHIATGNKEKADGLVYYLPLQDLVFSVKVAYEDDDANGSTTDTTKPAGQGTTTATHTEKRAAKPTTTPASTGKKKVRTLTPSVSVSDAYPDLAKAYVLRYNRSPFSKNAMTIEVNEKGLLGSAKAVVTDQLSETLKGLSTAAAPGGAKKILVAETETKECTDAGEYQRLVELEPSSPIVICGFEFTWKDKVTPTTEIEPKENFGTSVLGVFYRQLKPVIVTVSWPGSTSNKEKADFLRFVVDRQKKAHFLRIPRTLFADGNTEITFKDGMPTKYAPTTESEALAALKLPANVIGAYFGAVGNVFTAFSAVDKARTTAEADDAAVAFQQWKTEQCLAAIRASTDPAVIRAACGTSP